MNTQSPSNTSGIEEVPKCSVPGCKSSGNIEINLKSVSLFSFPTDNDLLSKQWEDNSGVNSNKTPNGAKICELHFENKSFADEKRNALIPDAVPTIFEFNNKRKISDAHKTDLTDASLPKQRKCEETELPGGEMSPRQNSSSRPTPENFHSKELQPGEPMEISDQVRDDLKMESTVPAVSSKEIDVPQKVYRLIIRIDKVIKNPEKTRFGASNITVPKQPTAGEPKLLTKNGIDLKPCAKRGCKLIKTFLNSTPVFQCEHCSKYYVVKENVSKASSWRCYICQEEFPSLDFLAYHIRRHFKCDMCQAQCATQISYDKHLKLHVSTDVLLPYKCHRCSNTFAVKAELRQHYAEKHPQIDEQHVNAESLANAKALYQCEYCYIFFKKERAYRNHLSSHIVQTEFDCDLCRKSFTTAQHLATHKAEHLGNYKFTCKVCSEYFTTSDAIEAHMKTHVEIVRDESKCNICKKHFESGLLLNDHMKDHLSRAHRCSLCHKAFVNKTTLRMHFKSHNAGGSNKNNAKGTASKKYSCTLCPNTFNTPSRLYRHVLTHIEKMHETGVEDALIDELGKLIESEEDTVS